MRVFFDSNIALYARLDQDLAKQTRAAALLRKHSSEGTAVFSTQVLQEVYVNLRRKAKPPLAQEDCLLYLDHLAANHIVSTDPALVRRAAQLCDSAKISFRDALIITAAASAECDLLYTEDLQPRSILGVQLVNPFL